ncbi:methionyl-tRNA formyltransferase [Christiangramia gaetbulicola]|uniref:Methionyl-tRNA formyltransferase n=1 Tax=Christiangramia gaetbulicola TaxID=703340 RepID=A0A2T6AFQ2_9FLAO|nr:hypothetical protein [Christiangramia gaetbulicola]PTX42616.1 methionyl-tRNA formyltransferase [Christiangramia gaetbulicola]
MKILLLAGNTLRSNSYAQYLAASSCKVEGLFYGFEEREYSVPKLNRDTEQFFDDNNILIPDFQIGIENVFERNKWKYQHINDYDVNSQSVVERVKSISPDLIIFSGYGGQILRKNHFDLDLPYVHMHPGDIPLERGSTTIYYSILNRQSCTVTAFLMNEKIDAGNIITKSHFPAPTGGVNIDQYYDNIIRANCLIDAITALSKKNEITPFPSHDNSLEYYVIHPILKNIGILSLKK